MQHTSVAIIGGGFSGTILALNLARLVPPGASVQLIERDPVAGPGLAFQDNGGAEPLNAPAARMSAWPEQPAHFLDWSRALPPAVLGCFVPAPGGFAPRRLYGLYIRDLLAGGLADAPPGRFTVTRGEVVALTRMGSGQTLTFADGRRLHAGIAVLATGHHLPVPPGIDDGGLFASSLYRNDPWSPDAIGDLDPDAAVLAIGTGLTMVDIAIRLVDRGHRGPIMALSRHGLLPRAHEPNGLTTAAAPPSGAAPGPRALIRLTRREIARLAGSGTSWHAAIDALRPVTQSIWRGWSDAERSQFHRHLRAFWDVHRHRMPADVAARIAAACERGQLRILAGTPVRSRRNDGTAEVIWRRRRDETDRTIVANRVINCTGPMMDPTRSTDPLTRSLLNDGLARPDARGLGLDTTAEGAIIARRGIASDRLFGIGPICRAALWEIVAVPEIRAQARSLACRIADRLSSDSPEWPAAARQAPPPRAL